MVTQTRWVDRKWTFDFDAGLFPIIYGRMLGTVSRLQDVFRDTDETKVATAETGWSAKEHLGHLCDLEELWWNRWEDYRDGKSELTPADITNRRTTESNHNAKEISFLLALFFAERKRMLEAIYGCDEEMLLRISLHPRLQTKMRLVDFLFFVAEHDDHHIAAIIQLLR